MKQRFFLYVLVPFVLVMFTGCAIVIQKGRRSDLDKIDSLESELNELKHTRGLLEDKLSKEISSNDVNVSMSNRGLVITFVVFQPGPAGVVGRWRRPIHRDGRRVDDHLQQHRVPAPRRAGRRQIRLARDL